MAEIIALSGSGWSCKPFLGLDWLARRSHLPGSRDVGGWLPAAVPGSVQHDVWQAGQAPDPYTELNSRLLEWVPQRTWLYRRTFTVPAAHRGRRIVLHFKGVDYAARFFLNGEPLGEQRGMFTPALFDVGHRLRYDEDNLLVVVIDPAPDEQPQVGRSSLVRTHKARMNYWWDFCPRMVHLGLWDDVQLEIGGAVRVEDVWVRPELDETLGRASVRLVTTLSSTRATVVALDVALLDPAGRAVAQQSVEQPLPAGATEIETTLDVIRPALWWPNGLGPQPLYRAEVRAVELTDSACEPSDARRVSFGFRRLAFAPHHDPEVTGRSYTLVVNGQRLYLTGWNWVPIDALYGVPRPEKLERLLRLARDAHVNLLRVWGGGLIEKEAFYDLCDRLGILVWQEFIQSSSGVDNVPPVDDDYVAMLTGEAAHIIARRRNHPSLAIWCGGNELTTAEGQPADESHPLLGALRRVVEVHDPGRPWLPTSPSGPEFNNTLETIARHPAGMHDVHGPWEHQGLVDHFTLYNQGQSRLHSEFGVEGITNRRTLDRAIPPQHQWPVSLDNSYWQHLGAWWLKEASLRAAFGELPDIDTTVRAAQFLQFDGLRYAVEADRRRQPANAGTLPWQFNEPYPMAACTSAVDYYARPKPAYYAVAAAYEPLHVSARFERQAWAGEETFRAEVWVNSSLLDIVSATLDARVIGAGGQEYAAERMAVDFPAGSWPLGAIGCDLAVLDEDLFFLDLALTAPGGDTVSANRYFFSRTDNLSSLAALPPTGLETEVDKDGDRWLVRLSNTGPVAALCVWIEDARPLDAPGGAFFDDNYVTLMPGESRQVAVTWHGVPPESRQLSIAGWNTADRAAGAIPFK